VELLVEYSKHQSMTVSWVESVYDSVQLIRACLIYTIHQQWQVNQLLQRIRRD